MCKLCRKCLLLPESEVSGEAVSLYQVIVDGSKHNKLSNYRKFKIIYILTIYLNIMKYFYMYSYWLGIYENFFTMFREIDLWFNVTIFKTYCIAHTFPKYRHNLKLNLLSPIYNMGTLLTIQQRNVQVPMSVQVHGAPQHRNIFLKI